MKTLLCAPLLFICGIAIAQEGDSAKDLEAMQGTWLVASLVEIGKALPAAELAVLEVTIEKDTFTVKEKGEVAVQYQIKLDPEKTPKAIDFTHLIGENKGKTEPGIYTFDKGQLKLCLDETRKGRPTVFEGKETEKFSVITLKKKDAE